MEKVVIGKTALDNDIVFGWPPSYYAIFLNNFDDLKFCIARGSDVNAYDGDGRTLLMTAIREGNISIVEFLLGCEGVNLLIRDNLGRSALDYAKAVGNPRIISLVESAIESGKGPESLDVEYDAEKSSLWDSEGEESGSDYESGKKEDKKEEKAKGEGKTAKMFPERNCSRYDFTQREG
jgi:hypothetical protein